MAWVAAVKWAKLATVTANLRVVELAGQFRSDERIDSRRVYLTVGIPGCI